MAAVDALRQAFTGTIVLFTMSQYGQFENPDILKKKFTNLTRFETFVTDLDFLDQAKVNVIRGGVEKIDWQKRQIYMKSRKERLDYDKLLVAWGSHKRRLAQEYSNAFYLEDRLSHTKCSEALRQAKSVVILGGTMDAY